MLQPGFRWKRAFCLSGSISTGVVGAMSGSLGTADIDVGPVVPTTDSSNTNFRQGSLQAVVVSVAVKSGQEVQTAGSREASASKPLDAANNSSSCADCRI